MSRWVWSVGCAAAVLVGAVPGVAAQGRVPLADYGWAVRPLEGEEVRLDQFRGEVLFINLWATWCRPCVAELESIERLRSSVEIEGVRFLMVSPESERQIQGFLRRHPYELTFYTESQRMPPAFGLRALPTTFIVDRGGRIVVIHRGAADWDTDRVRALLAGLASR